LAVDIVLSLAQLFISLDSTCEFLSICNSLWVISFAAISAYALLASYLMHIVFRELKLTSFNPDIFSEFGRHADQEIGAIWTLHFMQIVAPATQNLNKTQEPRAKKIYHVS